MQLECTLDPPIKPPAVASIEEYRTVPELELDADEVFPQSISSGGPTPTGGILWTRVAPKIYDEEVSLLVEVAQEESFTTNVYQSAIDADELRPNTTTLSKSTSMAN